MSPDSASPDLALDAMRQGLHDLNNQLALVIGGAELLAETPALPEELRGLIAAVLDGAEQASRVAARLQIMARGNLMPGPARPVTDARE